MMSLLLFFLLGSSAFALLFRPGPAVSRPRLDAPPSIPIGSPIGRLFRLKGHEAGTHDGEAWAMISMVRQLAALLAAGRSGPAIWHDLAVAARVFDHGIVASAGRWEATSEVGTATSAEGRPAQSRAAVLLATERAAAMGLSASAAIREACTAVRSPFAHPGRRGRSPASEQRVWHELAACLQVSESSGAPVAAVLTRFASRLESDLDAAALRRTALAGPRATARLLNWLPLLGLLLGVVLGADPLAVLTGTLVGWWCLGTGMALILLGRWWANRLIANAEGTARTSRGARRTLR